MRLVSLEVQGLKSLRNTKVDGLESYNVFIGKNNSGKSAILQGVELLGTVRKALKPQQAVEIITDRQLDGSLQLSVVFRLSDSELKRLPGTLPYHGKPEMGRLRRWRYELEMRPGDQRWPRLQLYLMRCGPIHGEDHGTLMAVKDQDQPQGGYNALPPELVAEVLRKPDESLQRALGSRWPGRPHPNAPIMAGGESSDEPFYVLFLREFLRRVRCVDPVRFAPDEMEVTAKLAPERSGADVTQVLETWRSSYPDRFGAIEGLMKDMCGDVRRLHLPREGRNTVVRVASGRELPPPQSFRLSHMGMGLQQALVVATAVVSAEDGAVILLEEPENNLHASAQRVLAEFLRQHAIENDKQILLTTHSTIFASQAEGCSTYLVRLEDDKGTLVRKLEPGGEPAVKEELGIRNVDLYGYNGVVMWEGDSESQAMPLLLGIIAEQRGTSIHRLGLTSRNLHGHTNIKLQSVREFLSLLKGLDVRPYVVMDDDEGVREELERLVEDDLLPLGHYHIWQKGREEHGRNPDIRCEFEDNFSNDQLVRAAMAVAEEAGVALKLDAADFAKRLEVSSKKTSDELCHYYRDEADYGLSKPHLSRKLAQQVAPELRGEAGRTVEQSEFEMVAQDIFGKLGGLT